MQSFETGRSSFGVDEDADDENSGVSVVQRLTKQVPNGLPHMNGAIPMKSNGTAFADTPGLEMRREIILQCYNLVILTAGV
jgi:hypothetical protein